MTREEYVNRKLSGINDFIKGQNFYPNDLTINNISKLCSYDKCMACGGKCCKRLSCNFAPFDFIDINDDGYMRALLDTGIICISMNYLRRDSPFTYLTIRPMSYHDNGKIVSNNMTMNGANNKCILHSDEKGCMLESEFRPTGGLLLLPDPPKCPGIMGIWEEIQLWGPYKKRIADLAVDYMGRFSERPNEEPSDERVKGFAKLLRGD